jgi:hypothetical protein
MVRWADVGVGDVVIGAKDKKAWEVTKKGPGEEVTIQNGERSYTFAPSGEVERLATASEMVAAAQASVKIVMPGAVTIAEQGPDKVWVCPNTYPDAGSLLSHLFVMHGKKLTETDLIGMLGEHRAWHDKHDVQKPHIHDKDFWRDRA